jgi:hypothetical protein
MEEKKQLKDMSLDELKILWFDQVELLEQVKVNLDVIVKEIKLRKEKP